MRRFSAHSRIILRDSKGTSASTSTWYARAAGAPFPRQHARSRSVMDPAHPAGSNSATHRSASSGSGTRPLRVAGARHWTAEACEQHRTMGFEAGWGAVADQLAAIAEGGD